MITEIIGAVVGSKLDQQDGDSGAKGAVIGYFTPRIVGAVVKVGLLAAIGYGVVKAVQSLTSENDANY
ncbi:hypothetical protein [Sphingobium yanoikuyae]|jgi:uncharacterized membrane protein YeaQ/YmgE (transglycosylase-associated protein family)|uniref:hypothetical protein n=1 Tax=Sphingobium yanoikuyae TaxID=13690 RepID=UPI0004E3F606|nr:hypothetical protein [Sphingobium yanoikuyae]KFD30056.1 hypothetical protein IH86_01395 [Sphingobium yanoikuyae]MDV3477928.1 hypothetical protein [Sphingobium yanoikuyae]